MMKSQYLYRSVLLFISITLSSCSFFSPVKTEPDTAYLINTTPTYVPTKARLAATLMVLEPDTVPMFNSTQMGYTPKRFQVAYYGKTRWAETPGQMLLPLLVQTLQRTRHFKFVVAPPFNGPYDYVLSMQILNIEHNYHLCVPPTFVLDAQVQLSKTGGEIIAMKRFHVVEGIRSKAPYGGVIAANRATAKLLQRIAVFCNQKV